MPVPGTPKRIRSVVSVKSSLHSCEDEQAKTLLQTTPSVITTIEAETPEGEDDVDEPPPSLQPLSRRSLASLFLYVTLAAATLAGGGIALAFEQEEPEFDLVASGCWKEHKEKLATGYNLINLTQDHFDSVLDNLKQCIHNEKRLATIEDTSLHAWSLYTTVGYGNKAPTTQGTRLFSSMYATCIIPLYLALKAEVGQLVSNSLLKFACLIAYLWRKKVLKVENPSMDPPPDGCLILLAFTACIIIVLITTLLTMAIDGIGFNDALYLVMITGHLIGIGDVAPGNPTLFLLIIFPFILVSDIFMSHINYYMQSIWRVLMVRSAGIVLPKKKKKEAGPRSSTTSLLEKAAVKLSELSNGSDRQRKPIFAQFPDVTTNAMPMNTLQCQKKEAGRNAELFSPDPPSVTCSEQSISQLEPAQKLSKVRARRRPSNNRASLSPSPMKTPTTSPTTNRSSDERRTGALEEAAKNKKNRKSSKERLKTSKDGRKSSKERLKTSKVGRKSSKERFNKSKDNRKSSKERLKTSKDSRKSSKERLKTDKDMQKTSSLETKPKRSKSSEDKMKKATKRD